MTVSTKAPMGSSQTSRHYWYPILMATWIENPSFRFTAWSGPMRGRGLQTPGPNDGCRQLNLPNGPYLYPPTTLQVITLPHWRHEWHPNKNLYQQSSLKITRIYLRKYTFINEALKKQLIKAAVILLLSSIKDQLPGFGWVMAMEMTNHLFMAYRAIDQIYPEEKSVCMVATVF